MNEPLTDRSEMPLEVLDQIDQICNRFEAAWEAGGRPRIEDELEQVAALSRAVLLSDLLAAEINARRRGGEHPTPDDYAARFPTQLALIEAVFAQERKRRADGGTTHGFTTNAAAEQATVTMTTRPTRAGAESGALEPGAHVRYFGDYEIERELGRGGMGVVYKARQISLNRPVALKMIRAELLADPEELRRFQNEAEAVALLDHPHVVPVYEVGEHEGQKYFTMKLVPGGSLSAILERYSDDPRAAARLVAEAADAVHHAHQRGILHRDLKPGNILVDDQGHAQVTDFGLAKRLEGDSELSHTGQILGTPAYMAPEQASGRRGAVTTVTDVYGLGTILYALVTGKAPFVGDSVADTLEQVRNQPPEPPTKLNAKVTRDLETICLKCLEKDPRRRYASAQALADDLRNWIDSRPIVARRVGTMERARLWCRRRPAIAGLAAGLLLAIVGGGITSTALWLRVEQNYQAEQDARSHAQARYELAMEAIAAFHTGVSEDFLLKEPQFKDLRDRLLRSASDFYERLETLLERHSDFASRRALGHVRFELASLTAKVGRVEDALAALRRVLAYQKSLASGAEADLDVLADLGYSHTGIGRLLNDTGEIEQAETTLREGVARLSPFAGSPSATERARHALAQCRMYLGRLLMIAGRNEEALSVLERARDEIESLAGSGNRRSRYLTDQAFTFSFIGAALWQMGKTAESVEAHRESLKTRETLAATDPADPEFKRGLGLSHHNLGWTVSILGRVDEALASYRRAAEIQKGLADAEPAVTIYQYDLAFTYINLANLLSDSGRQGEALELYLAALPIQSTLAAGNPGSVDFRVSWAGTINNIGNRHWDFGRRDEALSRYFDSKAEFERIVGANPHLSQPKYFLSIILVNIGKLLHHSGELDKALESHTAAREILDALTVAEPDNLFYPDGLAGAMTYESEALRALGRLDRAISGCNQAVEIREKLVQSKPDVPGFRGGLAYSLSCLGAARQATGEPAEAAALFRGAVELWEGVETLTYLDSFDFACGRARLASLASEPNSGISAQEAIHQADEAIRLLSRAVAGGFRNPMVFHAERDLDALRDREDFQLLLMDVAMPAEPMAR
jgi:serine/threonine-protein kinase